MAMKPAKSGSYSAATATDLYVNSSGTKYAISKLLQIYNADTSAIAVLLTITDTSNVVKSTLFNSNVPAGTMIMDDGFHEIEPGYKIRFTVTGSTLVQFEASMVESLD